MDRTRQGAAGETPAIQSYRANLNQIPLFDLGYLLEYIKRLFSSSGTHQYLKIVAALPYKRPKDGFINPIGFKNSGGMIQAVRGFALILLSIIGGA